MEGVDVPRAHAQGQYDGDGGWVVDKRVRDFVATDHAILVQAVRRSYDARSGFVHAGRRTITSTSELYSMIHETSAERPLSYAVLRSILTTLIGRTR